MAEDFSHFIEELKGKTDIIEVASRYMTLTQKGKTYWACCPYHSEKTPSFAINQADQYFHCFGCKESGDVIKLMQRLEGVDFMGAVEILAKMARMEMPTFKGSGNKSQQEGVLKKRQRLYSLLTATAKFYYSNLSKPSGTLALEYFSERGISKSSIVKFGLGYSVDWNSLVRHLQNLKFSVDEMVEAGVVKVKNGRPYDVLAERIIVPIIDGMGQVVAFGGRVLKKTDFAKYKNTENTVVFTKNAVLFGLNLVKKNRSDIKNIIVVEGYMDAISLYEAGYNNVVASMGTSFTNEQAKKIKNLTDDVYISYDGDFAGIEASMRGLDMLEKEGKNVYVVILPEGLDPDDMIRKRGKEAYDEALKNALPLVDYKLYANKQKYNLDDPVGRRKFLSTSLAMVAKLTDKTLQSEMLQKLAEMSNVAIQDLESDFARITAGVKTPLTSIETGGKERVKDAPYKAMRYLILSLVEGKSPPDGIDLLKYAFDKVHKKILQYVFSNEGKEIKKNMLFSVLDESEYEELTSILDVRERENIQKENEDGYYNDCIKLFKKYYLESDLERLKREFKKEEENTKRSEIARRIQEITLELQPLKV